MQAPTVQLKPGSKDVAAIKQLQDYLVSLGLLDKAAISGTNSPGYGVYGPRTTKAVAALQKQLGVDTSKGGVGNYGPLTSSAAIKTSTTPAQTKSQTYDPFSVKVDTNTTTANDNYNFGGGEYLTPEEMSALVKANYDEQSPFYEAQQNYELADFGNTEKSILDSYDLASRDYAARAQEDLDALNDTEGKSGTWASSERIKRRNAMQDKYNRSYESLYNNNVDNLFKTRLNRAYNYGDSQVGANNPMMKFGVSFGDNAVTNTNLGGGGTYNPFGFQGRRNVERKNNANLGAINALETFSYKNKFIK